MDILSCVDRWGRIIVLTERAWLHILAEHEELEGQEGAIDATITHPDYVMDDAKVPDRLSFYRTNVLAEPYGEWFLKVCVTVMPEDEMGTVVAEIVTAYPTPTLKRGETQRWP